MERSQILEAMGELKLYGMRVSKPERLPEAPRRAAGSSSGTDDIIQMGDVYF